MGNPFNIYVDIFLIWVILMAIPVIYSLLIRFGPKLIREWLKNHRRDKDV